MAHRAMDEWERSLEAKSIDEIETGLATSRYGFPGESK